MTIRLYPANTMGEPLLRNHETSLPATATICAWNHLTICHGIGIGISLQVINICWTAFTCYNWDVETGLVPKDSSGVIHFLRWVVWIVTQAHLLFSLLVWIGLAAILTYSSAKWVQRRTGGNSPRSKCILAFAVSYTATVIRQISNWALLNAAFGIPAPILPTVGVLVGLLLLGFLIVYSMIRCFDIDDNRGNDDEADEGTDEEATYRLIEETSTTKL
eukprot:scaffold1729_cov117-Cylindrotheca_fusiformis.AAC.7